MDDALKTRGIIYLNVETWFLFVPPIKISGCAPAPNMLYVLSSFVGPIWYVLEWINAISNSSMYSLLTREWKKFAYKNVSTTLIKSSCLNRNTTNFFLQREKGREVLQRGTRPFFALSQCLSALLSQYHGLPHDLVPTRPAWDKDAV